MSVITTTYAKDKQLSKSFKLSEFLCKDGTKTVKYSKELIEMLQSIIDRCGCVSLGKVISAYRTPDYSVKVGGTKGDAHTVGIAVDIQFKDKSKKIIPIKYIACFAQDMGFGGIGVMGNSIHLDVRHLGGYANKKWWGDETKNYSLSKNKTDFYNYYNLTREEVYAYLQIDSGESVKSEKENTENKSVIREENTMPITAIPSKPENAENSDAESVLLSDNGEKDAATEEASKETALPNSESESIGKRIFDALKKLLKLIFAWVKDE